MGGYTEAARLIEGTNLRAVLLALRHDVRDFRSPSDSDSTLVQTVERPFDSVGETADRLSQLEAQLRERDDRRAVFLSIYLRMTQEVHNGVENSEFADSEWMEEYLVTFANYYRRAFLAFERGNLGAVPAPWRIAFGTAIRGDALVIQDALLGVNAHINYDLALALADVGTTPERPQKYADHRAINDVLARLVDIQQEMLAEVYAPGIADLDAALGEFDESFMLLSMTEGREQAWRVATIMADVGWPPVASYARWVLRTTATGGAFFILTSTIDPSVFNALRRVEEEKLDLEVVLGRTEARIDEAR